MKRTYYGMVAGAVVFAGVACMDTSGPTTSTLDDAFLAAPAGFDQIQSSYDPSGTGGMGPWAPPGRGDHGPGGPGGFMGGGLGGDFLGGVGGPGFGGGPFGRGPDGHFGIGGSTNCPFNGVRDVCPAVTDRGLTINRTIQYAGKNGTPIQAALDTVNTDVVTTTVSVSGTVVHHDNDTSTVKDTSFRQVSGLSKGSTTRTVNGSSSGTESTVGTNGTGHFTATRSTTDKTTNLVIPIPTAAGQQTYPTSGTVSRSMTATVTYTGQSPKTTSRSETITYNGTATAQVTITQDGTTKTCTLPLPHGRLSCP